MFLVELVDTVDGNFDEFLSAFVAGCVAVLDVTAVGVLLADRDGRLEAAAHEGEPAGLLAGIELADGDGPGVVCHAAGVPASYPTNSALAVRWPGLARAADQAGIAALYTLPMRRRDRTVGVLTLLGNREYHLRDDTLQLAQALTEAATVGLLNQRTIQQHRRTATQLRTALSSRIVIEQAKGVLAGRLRITVDAAFVLLRAHARSNNRNLHEVAAEVAKGDLTIS
ncbi:GAF and ANTAR domain-containing protein [Asanoa iriomotensis]|nr:GAF and ANTAR domain-containing protein [Asanoa iriomotensis]